MPLSKDLREFLALLNSNKVEYLVVADSPSRGALHHFRLTSDMTVTS
jgi:hypothetical protein